MRKLIPLLLALMAFTPFTQAQQCLKGIDARIVVMLDQTRSMSATQLEGEKEAARALLRFFAPLSPRPSVAVGSFSEVNEDQQPDDARIVAPLSTNYGTESPATDLFASINTISGAGGNTNLAVALQVAGAELARISGGPGYVILLSDGTATRPGPVGSPYGYCGACGCPAARAAATTAADVLKNMGIRIYTIFQDGTNSVIDCTSDGQPAAGIELLKSGIASGATYAYQESQNLTDLFQSIASQVSCDDGNPCTIDTCSGQTCTSIPVVPNKPDATLDRCGVCDGDGTSCLGCARVDAVSRLPNTMSQQYASLSKALSYTPKVYSKKAKRSLRSLNNKALAILKAFQQSPGICTNLKFCKSVDNRPRINQLRQTISSMKKLARQAAAKNKRNRRAKSVNSNTSKLLKQCDALAKQVPLTTSSCS